MIIAKRPRRYAELALLSWHVSLTHIITVGFAQLAAGAERRLQLASKIRLAEFVAVGLALVA